LIGAEYAQAQLARAGGDRVPLGRRDERGGDAPAPGVRADGQSGYLHHMRIFRQRRRRLDPDVANDLASRTGPGHWVADLRGGVSVAGDGGSGWAVRVSSAGSGGAGMWYPA